MSAYLGGLIVDTTPSGRRHELWPNHLTLEGRAWVDQYMRLAEEFGRAGRALREAE